MQKANIRSEDADGVLCVVKRMQFYDDEREQFHVQAFLREMSITAEASVAPFTVVAIPREARVVDDVHTVYVRTRMCEEGSLLDRMRDHDSTLCAAGGELPIPFYPLRLIALYTYELVTALVVLHALGIAHCDIKLENIFVEHRHLVRLGDFGLACRYTHGKRYMHHGGTRKYAAPEKQYRAPLDLEKSDVWSLGCCLYAMYIGDLPGRDPLVPDLDDGAHDTIEPMLRDSDEKRARFADLIGTPLFERGRVEFESLFGYTVDTSAYTRDCTTGFDDAPPCPKSSTSLADEPAREGGSPRAEDDETSGLFGDRRTSPRRLVRMLSFLRGKGDGKSSPRRLLEKVGLSPRKNKD